MGIPGKSKAGFLNPYPYVKVISTWGPVIFFSLSLLQVPVTVKPIIENGSTEKWPCDICTKTFTTVHYLRTHKQIVHEKRKEHACPYCSKEFGSRSGEKHVRHLVAFVDPKAKMTRECSKTFYDRPSFSPVTYFGEAMRF